MKRSISTTEKARLSYGCSGNESLSVIETQPLLIPPITPIILLLIARNSGTYRTLPRGFNPIEFEFGALSPSLFWPGALSSPCAALSALESLSNVYEAASSFLPSFLFGSFPHCTPPLLPPLLFLFLSLALKKISFRSFSPPS